MASNPGVSFFISFFELDPTQQRQCIYFTKKGERCRWDCTESDNQRAKEIHQSITAAQAETPEIEVLENYARYNCCGPQPKGVRHQNRIEDIELLNPLAGRWQEEIKQRAAQRALPSPPVTPAAVRWVNRATSPKAKGESLTPSMSPSTGRLFHRSLHAGRPALDVAALQTGKMASNPGVSFFISFFELDPTQQRQCIYFTKKGERCRWDCTESDNQRAKEIHQSITAARAETPEIEVLENYARYNCCGPQPKGVRHQNRIEDIELLNPLAGRWQEEIKQRAAQRALPSPVTPAAVRWVNRATSPKAKGESLTPSMSPSTGRLFHRSLHAGRPVLDVAALVLPLSPPATPPSIADRSGPIELQSSHPKKVESRYNLRPRATLGSTPAGSANSSSSTPKTRLSEFRPHVQEPSENVSSKFRSPLKDRDFEAGSLYIFDRVSSPGYVKIGWTAQSVQRRLDSWATCGYVPNPLYSVHEVFPAQRAETLTHYELIKEWRAERMCKGCTKSHQEWFEITEAKAKRVVAGWAEFMRVAKPYSADGLLDARWVAIVDSMDKRGQPVNVEALLARHKASIAALAAASPAPTPLAKQSVFAQGVSYFAFSQSQLSSTMGQINGQYVVHPFSTTSDDSRTLHPLTKTPGNFTFSKSKSPSAKALEASLPLETVLQKDDVDLFRKELKHTGKALLKLRPELIPLPPSPPLEPTVPLDYTAVTEKMGPDGHDSARLTNMGVLSKNASIA